MHASTIIRPSNRSADSHSLDARAVTTVSWAIAKSAVPDDYVGTAGSRWRRNRLIHHDQNSSNDSNNDCHNPYDNPELLTTGLRIVSCHVRYSVRIFVIVIVDICYVPKLPDNSREKLPATTSAMLLGQGCTTDLHYYLQSQASRRSFSAFLVRLVFPRPV